jgi:GNAT superfamily N-acetyltransferase
MFQIIAPTAKDIPAICRMIKALATHHGDTATVTATTLRRDVFGAIPWFHLLVAKTPAGLQGYAALLPLGQLQYAKREMDLHHLFVTPAARGQGIGRALIAAAIAHARTLGCTSLRVGTAPDNLRAQAFYLDFGFTPSTNYPRFRLDL